MSTLHSLERPLRAVTGARASRIIDAAGVEVPTHAHDWPILSIYVAGGQDKQHDRGTFHISRPAVVYHGARGFHSSVTGRHGLEQIDIEFDPVWAGFTAAACRNDVICCIGGPAMKLARDLVGMWQDVTTSERALSVQTAQLVTAVSRATPKPPPVWLEKVLTLIERDDPPTSIELGRMLRLHPAWVAQAFREHMGEGLRETIRRRRVERASTLLRQTTTSAAEVAVTCGFYDQAHMIRAFRHLLGRTPSKVRSEFADDVNSRWQRSTDGGEAGQSAGSR